MQCSHTQAKALRRCHTAYKHSLFIPEPHINMTHTHARTHTHTVRVISGKTERTRQLSLRTDRKMLSHRCLLHTVSPNCVPFNHTHTYTHAHHSAFGWNYRSDFSSLEMQEDDSGRLNQGAMNQCLIKPLALGMNCQHRNTHTHTALANISLPQLDTATPSQHVCKGSAGRLSGHCSLFQSTVCPTAQLFSQRGEGGVSEGWHV